MRKLALALVALAALVATGCGDSQSTATKSEENGYRNPSKYPPPEAGQMGPKTPSANQGSPLGPPPGAKAGQ
ncbi:MAG: hypothetical protein JSS65_10310 [Armatimonadetes bacterium]|nr:hypothetical protein [Armatimonadota bacterium]